tara:strand:+ start:3724 stop:4650 length:927 start_codon:yes stop_codon:yes gene_type:complete
MAVNEDIRIKIDLFNHPKFQELEEEHGAGVCLRLFQLWGAVARFKPDGILTGWTVRTIARQAGAEKSEAESLVSALVDSGFLDFDGQVYSCHDWADHQPWAAGVKDREKWAKKMNQKKIEKRRRLQLAKIEQTDTGTGTETDTETGTETDTATGTVTDTPHHLSNSLPTPVPKPKPAPKPTHRAPDEISQVINDYREILEPVGFLPLNRVYLSDKTAIRAALGLGCGEEPRSASELREYFVSLKARAGDSSLMKSGQVGLKTILKPENIRDLENGAWADIDQSKPKPKNQTERVLDMIEKERRLQCRA